MNLKQIAALILVISSTPAFANNPAETNQNPNPIVLAAATAPNSPEANLQEGAKFLKENQKLPGVVTLSSGLQYKILKAGNGPKPLASDTVTVDYEGRFIDGREFDSSSKHGGPISFPLNQVIPGWTEVVQLMPKGSTWEVYIPGNLAYGAQGAGADIGPNKTLIFKITLIDFKKTSA